MVLRGRASKVGRACAVVVVAWFVVGADGELVGGAIAGGGIDAVDASSFGEARVQCARIVHCVIVACNVPFA